MHWTTLFVLLALTALFLLVKRAGRIPLADARKHLKSGALLIDVRTAGEFVSGHLPRAINLPVNEIDAVLPRRVPDKSKVLLVHCQTGLRCGIAKRKMKSLGYVNVFSIGPYARAAQAVNGK
jgi:rhodanese-related sulfurtransferase